MEAKDRPARRSRTRDTSRHPALILLRISGALFLGLVLVIGVLSWRDTQRRIDQLLITNNRRELRMLRGFLADEGRQLHLVSLLVAEKRTGLLKVFLRGERRRFPALAMYDALGMRQAAWGSEGKRLPTVLRPGLFDRAPRYAEMHLLAARLEGRPVDLLIVPLKRMSKGWLVAAMPQSVLERLLLPSITIPGFRLVFCGAHLILAGYRSRRRPPAFLRPVTNAFGLGSQGVTSFFTHHGKGLFLRSEIPASGLLVYWWQRNLIPVVLVLILLSSFVILERTTMVLIGRELDLQRERDIASARRTQELEARLRHEQRLQNMKEVQRRLNDAVVRHVPEGVLYRLATELLDGLSCGRGFWIALYDEQKWNPEADVVTPGGWHCYLSQRLDATMVRPLYETRSGPDSDTASLDPVRRLEETGEPLLLPKSSEAIDLDPRWRTLLERRGAEGFIMFPLVRDPILVGHCCLLLGPENLEKDYEDTRECLREIAQIISYGITDLAARHALEYASLHDLLTGIPNRRLFHDRLQQLFNTLERDGIPFGLAILDLDDFKAINDTHGHLMGDRVLVALASRLRDTLRNTDTVARLGGDEFALLLPRLTPDTAPPFLERLREAVVRPYDFGAVCLDVRPSLGLACAPRDGRDRHRLMRAADDTLYKAKALGGGTWLIHDPRRDDRLHPVPEVASQPSSERSRRTIRIEPEVDLRRGRLTGIVLQPYEETTNSPCSWGGDSETALGQSKEALTSCSTPPPIPGLSLTWSCPATVLEDTARLSEAMDVLRRLRESGWRPLLVLESHTLGLTPHQRRLLRGIRAQGIATAWQLSHETRCTLDDLVSLELDRGCLAPELVVDLPHRLWTSTIVTSFFSAAELLDLDVLAPAVTRGETTEVLMHLGCRRISGPWVGPTIETEDLTGRLTDLARERWDGKTIFPLGLGGLGDLPLLLFRPIHEPWFDRSYVRLYLRRRGRPPCASDCSLDRWFERRLITVVTSETRVMLAELRRLHTAFHESLEVLATTLERSGRHDPAPLRSLWSEMEELVATLRLNLLDPASRKRPPVSGDMGTTM